MLSQIQRGGRAGQSPLSVVSRHFHAVCLSPRCSAPAPAHARVCVHGHRWWGVQPTSSTRRSAWESSFNLLPVHLSRHPPSCPRAAPGTRYLHKLSWRSWWPHRSKGPRGAWISERPPWAWAPRRTRAALEERDAPLAGAVAQAGRAGRNPLAPSPHTYRCAWLPFPAWQPLSIHDHTGLSLNEDEAEKSVPKGPVVSPCAEWGHSTTRPGAQQGDRETLGSPRHRILEDAMG